MTPPPLDEKVKNHSQRFISKTNNPIQTCFLIEFFSKYFFPHSWRIYAITLRRTEKSGGGKHLVHTGGARCVKVSFTRVPSTFPLKKLHRRSPTGTKLSTSSQNPSIEGGESEVGEAFT